MHPHTDADLAAIVGRRPTDRHVWCDECCRWEAEDRNVRPVLSMSARLWLALQRFADRLAGYCERRATLAQARHNITKGSA